jgi:hypothetical protein
MTAQERRLDADRLDERIRIAGDVYTLSPPRPPQPIQKSDEDKARDILRFGVAPLLKFACGDEADDEDCNDEVGAAQMVQDRCEEIHDA